MRARTEVTQVEQAVSSSDRTNALDLALARSVVYRAMATAFQRPSGLTLETLGSSDARRTVRDAAALLDGGRVDTPPLTPAVGQLARACEQARLADLVDEHDRLFGHTARGVVCPFETEYGSSAPFQQPQTLADIAGFYRAFGLRTRSAINERVDHIGCECDIEMFLALKEAYVMEALGSEDGTERDIDTETLEETRKASALFLRDHIGRFGRAFANALMKESPDRFHGCAARVLYRLLDLDCARLNVPVGPLTLELRSDAEDETPIGCGGEPQLIQIQRNCSAARSEAGR